MRKGKLKVQRFEASEVKLDRKAKERLRQHQENFTKRNEKIPTIDRATKNSSFSQVKGYFSGSKHHDDQRSGRSRQRDKKGEKSKFYMQKKVVIVSF